MNLQSKRYFIELAFNGEAYHGWQIQHNANTVQEMLNIALSKLLRGAVETVGCGRTDTGVHAKQLYAHFDDNHGMIADNEDRILTGMNALLPRDIAVKRLFAVDQSAHARFDAVKRSYEYHVHFNKDPFLYGRSWQIRDKPNVEAMNEAAQLMMAYKDFSCFSKSHTQVFTNNCVITHAAWQWLNTDQLVFYISADRFLRNMVRAIVGTLMEIGSGKQPVGYIRNVIESKNRSKAGVSVPACGLYLTEVLYPWDLT
ncbi:tRNA pseudouridine(38-40) synthase TruA [Olivibacter sp. SDN3]|uniref:tRNA pseudouridine(38-40) synthase TruA n=1 Tax=Olivibacter sp. SDN3 TaxID=2764720 RepID=UPI0016518D0A|nr:tRNA pseudouridine(38-40) synthase TruA [Olivibacter sp. SDN3]QNL47715.1 tRNA pseudouridine(38-40) synthase TruA [Olivibacter sp. SDN3]